MTKKYENIVEIVSWIIILLISCVITFVVIYTLGDDYPNFKITQTTCSNETLKEIPIFNNHTFVSHYICILNGNMVGECITEDVNKNCFTENNLRCDYIHSENVTYERGEQIGFYYLQTEKCETKEVENIIFYDYAYFKYYGQNNEETAIHISSKELTEDWLNVICECIQATANHWDYHENYTNNDGFGFVDEKIFESNVYFDCGYQSCLEYPFWKCSQWKCGGNGQYEVFKNG